MDTRQLCYFLAVVGHGSINKVADFASLRVSADARHLDHVVPKLAADYMIVLVDLRGYGDSVKRGLMTVTSTVRSGARSAVLVSSAKVSNSAPEGGIANYCQGVPEWLQSQTGSAPRIPRGESRYVLCGVGLVAAVESMCEAAEGANRYARFEASDVYKVEGSDRYSR